MGAKLYGFRKGRLNDNFPSPKVGKADVPIAAEERRNAPVIEFEAGVRWYCLITVPQGEYRCADGLNEAGIATYVPTHTTWQWKTRGRERLNHEMQRPLFRGYCFARLSPWSAHDDEYGFRDIHRGRDWDPIFARDKDEKSLHGILKVMANSGFPVPMPIRDMSAMAMEERAGWFDDRKRPALVRAKAMADAAAVEAAKEKPVVMAGERVRINDGPFAGMTATALNDNDERGSVRLMRDLLGRMTAMTISISALENLDRPQDRENNVLRRA